MTSLPETVIVDQAELERMVIPEILPLCEGRPPGYFGVLLIDRLTRGVWTRQTRWRLESEVDWQMAHRVGPPKPPGDWVERAACIGQKMLYDTFMAHYNKITQADREMERHALATCRRCPVLEQCRSWATQPIEPAVDHVAGGLTPRERADYRRRKERGLCP